MKNTFFLNPLAIRFRILAALILGLIGVSSAFAHLINPSTLELLTSTQGQFSVSDSGSCSATISAASGNTNIATVSPDWGIGVSVTFNVDAGTNVGTTTIAVQWVGEDVGGEGPCQDVASGSVTVKVIDPKPQSSANNNSSHVAGDPVNTFNGELYFHEQPDLDLGGPLPVVFQRYYASRMKKSSVEGALGDNWRHNFEWRLHWVGNYMVIISPTARVMRYLKQGDVWDPIDNLDTPYQVVQNGAEIVLGDPSKNLYYRFNSGGKLIEIGDGKGNYLFATYDFNGRLSEIKDNATTSSARILQFSYTGQKLYSVQERYGFSFARTIYFNYNGNNLDSVSDPAGGLTQYIYDTTHADPGLLTSKVMPQGNIPYQQTYDIVGKVATQKDAYNNTTSFDYGDPYAPGTTIVTQADGRTYTHLHDADGSLVSIIDQAGNTLNFGNDDNRRRTSIPNLEGGSIDRSFHAGSGRLAQEINEAGEETLVTYVSRTLTNGVVFHDVATITHPNGATELFYYDSSGNLTSRVDEASNVWTQTFNSNGQLLVATNPEGGSITNTYNTFRELLTTRDSAGTLASNTYNSLHRLTRITFADANYREFTYDNLNRRTSIRDERGNIQSFIFDRNGNLRTNSYPVGNRTIYTYDNMDRVVSVTDAQGQISRVGYDNQERLVSTTNRVSGVQTNEFDALDRMTSVTDEAGRKWHFTYNEEGWLTAKTDPLANTTARFYDAAGRLIREVSPQQNEAHYTYNSLGLMSSFQEPGGQLTSFTHDPRGLMSSVSIANGLTSATFLRNKLGLVTNIVDANGESWRKSYDSQGRVIATTDPLGNSTTQQYNNRSRGSQVTFPGGLGTMSVTYDGVGNITQRSFSDGLVRNYTYDANNRCTSANSVTMAYDSRKSMTNCNGISIGRDAEKRISSITFAPGKTVAYTYNSLGVLASVSDWAGGGITFTYDNAGRLTNMNRLNGVQTTFAYDGERRLTSIQEGALSSIAITRNANGFVASAARNVPLSPAFSSATNTFAYDAASQLSDAVYDAMGRMTSGNGRTFTWNLASRITSYNDGTNTTTFGYDGVGNVISRGSDNFVWNYGLTLPSISILRQSSADVRYYVHDPSGHLLYSIEASDNSRRYYHFDEAGNTLFLTGNAGNVTDTYAYLPYGEPAGSTGSFNNLFTYQGRFGVMKEGSAGLYIMRQRIYDSSTKRFLSRDPETDFIHPAKLNPYQYAIANPLEFNDPTGEDPTPTQATDYTGFAGNYIGGLGTVLDGPADDIAGWAAKGSSAAKLGAGAGIAGQVLSQGTELVKANQKMDEVSDKFRKEQERNHELYNNRMAEIRRSWKRRLINYDEYSRLRSQFKQEWDEANARALAQFELDTIAAGTITGLNILTAVVPFAGFFVDWGDYIDYK